jgi:2-oxoglutarate dehydrogenase E1 component
MTPKSLLRHKLCVSPVADFTDGTFQTVLGDVDPIDPAKVRRVILCSGKIFYDLLVARRERDIDDIAFIRVEQLYPFPEKELRTALEVYPERAEVMWAQEEPQNMGAWDFMFPRLLRLVGKDRPVLYAGRRPAASPATGSYKVHQSEEQELIHAALRRTYAR